MSNAHISIMRNSYTTKTASLTRKTFDSLDEYFAEYAVLPDSPRLFRFRANTCWSPRGDGWVDVISGGPSADRPCPGRPRRHWQNKIVTGNREGPRRAERPVLAP